MDEFTQAYIECALWTSIDDREGGSFPLDDTHSIDDIAPETLEEIIADCQAFQNSFGLLIASDLPRAGHDFWLTRNSHGAGFWDGHWSSPFTELDDDNAARMIQRYRTVGDYLTEMSKPFGSYDLYVGDDNLIYGS